MRRLVSTMVAIPDSKARMLIQWLKDNIRSGGKWSDATGDHLHGIPATRTGSRSGWPWKGSRAAIA